MIIYLLNIILGLKIYVFFFKCSSKLKLTKWANMGWF